MKLKLFVWEGVLTDYTDGIMFALAHNIEEARKLIRDEYCPTSVCGECGFGDEFCNLINEMQTEPAVYESPVGFFLWGGG